MAERTAKPFHMKQIGIAAADEGMRFDRWAKANLPGIPFVRLQQALRKGSIRLDGKRLKPETRLIGGQVVAIRPEVLTGAEASAAKPARVKMVAHDPQKQRETERMVIYRNARCLVLNKPAGLATQGGSGIKDSIDDRLKLLVEEGEEPLRLVHRIDKDTSGVLVIARTRQAATELTKAFAGKEIEKVYWALVVGLPVPFEGVIDAPIEKLGAREKMELSDDGQRAVTEYRVVEHLANRLAWVELKPITGRTHQLRVHMASIGHPIYGDGKYGGREAFVDGMELAPQLHLHARRVSLRGLDVTAPLPAHMKRSWKALGLNLPR